MKRDINKPTSGRYPWKETNWDWLYGTAAFDLILTSMLNHNFLTRNDIWKIFDLPDNGTGKSIIKDSFEFFSTLEIANHTCKQIYGKTLEEKCKEDWT